MIKPTDEKAQNIVDATYTHTLRPKGGDRPKVIAAAFRELINQFAYTHLYLDVDHGLGVVNVRDIESLIEELNKLASVKGMHRLPKAIEN